MLPFSDTHDTGVQPSGEHKLFYAYMDNRMSEALPGRFATCPHCRGHVGSKCGPLVSWHWAHVSGAECDPWSEGETEWHKWWKSAAPIERREVSIGSHRADVIAGDGAVCELQHSPIAYGDARMRESFYGDMRWLFDARDKGFEIEQKRGGAVSVHRPHAWPSIAHCARRVMLDLGAGLVVSLENVNESGSSGYGYTYPYQTVRMWLAGPAHWAVSR